MKISRFSWEEYYALVKILISKVKESYTPDVIVSIGKGGSIPGVIIAEQLGVDNFNYGLKSYNKHTRTKIVEYQPLKGCYKELKNKKVLMVDDLVDSGLTLVHALSVLNKNSCIVNTACVFFKNCSILEPNYWVVKADKHQWIQHPWEL